MARAGSLLLIALAGSSLMAPASGEGAMGRANPVRKVVTLLQAMTDKVTAEGEKEEKMFQKFMCYCKNSGGDLQKSVEDAKTRIPDLEATIKEGTGKQEQLEADIKSHKADREAAKKAMGEATGIRAKDKAVFDKETADDKTNVAGIDGAITAISAGMGSGFLQTDAAASLKRLVQIKQEDMDASDARDLLSFLSGTQQDGYAPQSGQIAGILKQMRDEMASGLAEAEEAEAKAAKEFEELIGAKKKEVKALTKLLEEKLTRAGENAVETEEAKNDLEDTSEALAEDEKLLVALEKGCSTKQAEWDERVKTRQEELVALADTIKVLNDDDALELFKKTLPSAAASLLQVQVSSSSMRSQAQDILNAVRRKHGAARPGLDFISLALHGKKVGFEKVILMIDNLVGVLKAEQADDDKKKEYCAAEFDASDDKKKELERSVADAETAISKTEEDVASLADGITALKDSIRALDASVAEATANRKEQNQDFKELMASDSTAKEVLGFAKNRLNKFYNPKLYKAAPKRELSEADQITVNNGGTLAPTAAPGGIAGTGIGSFVQVSMHTQLRRDAPAPAPETPSGAYVQKSQESGGVIAMIDLLIKDLDKEMTLAKAEEKDSQQDYEKAMSDAAEKRAQDAKALANKDAAKAEAEAALGELKEAKKSASNELGTTLQYIASLHSECDWLLQYFTVRKEARADEVDSLGKAKAVLSGADFSLLQVSAVSRRAGRFLA